MQESAATTSAPSGPRLDAPFAGRNHDPIEVARAGANEIMNEVMVRPHHEDATTSIPRAATHAVGCGGAPALQLHCDAVSALGQSDAPMVKMKHAARHCRGKNVEQFGAMEVIIGGAEVSLAGVGQGLPSDHAPVVPRANDGRARPHSEEAQRLLKSEPMENSRRIGTYLDAGADLAQFR